MAAFLRAATYNIRMDTPADGLDRWELRKGNVLRVIGDRCFDVIGFQEVKKNQLADLAQLSDYAFFGDARSADDGAEANPIFYRPSRLEVIDSGTFWLSETGKQEEAPRRWHADCPRICTWGRFRLQSSKKELMVYNTHFDHKSEEARFQSALLLQRVIRDEAENRPVIVMGDLNGGEEERFYHVFQHEAMLQDAVRVSPQHRGPYGTCTGRSFCHALPWEEYQRIDYVFVNSGLLVNKTETATDCFDGRYPSDHFAVEMEAVVVEGRKDDDPV